MSEKQDLMNAIASRIQAEIPGMNISTLISLLALEMEPYDISKSSREITVYRGFENKKLIEKFLVCKRVKGLTPKSLTMYKESIHFLTGLMGNPPLISEEIEKL
ncbi:hypothetical protein [uncultured Dubosiella sp.]|uniref:hypothetical protein n=1 Tax=uncultured Dubosiella sp. TaxID=1937011 RepID=UPI0025987CC8|nr:hypothetical protein [uncultured Dubosiella sp.]